MEHLDTVFWLTGAAVWTLLGGAAVVAVLSAAALLLGMMALRAGRAMIGEVGSLGDVAQWIKAGKPRLAQPDRAQGSEP
jgi:hypothetical protein